MLDLDQSASLTQPAVLVTIITESILKESIIKLLKSLKVMGYSISEVEGGGHYARLATIDREAESPDTQVETPMTTSIEIRAVLSQEVSNVVLYALKEQQGNFAIIAYRQTIEVLGEV